MPPYVTSFNTADYIHMSAFCVSNPEGAFSLLFPKMFSLQKDPNFASQ